MRGIFAKQSAIKMAISWGFSHDLPAASGYLERIKKSGLGFQKASRLNASKSFDDLILFRISDRGTTNFAVKVRYSSHIETIFP